MVKEFKNGNINIKFDADEKQEAKKDFFLTLSEVVYWYDMYIIGDVYCIGNACEAFDVYNVRLDKIYMLTDSMIEGLKNGYSIKLYATEPDTADREKIADCF